MTESLPVETPKLIYSIIDRSAMKIVTLIKIANLDYEISEGQDEAICPHVLQTQHGELYKQYEIISYIVSQSKRISEQQQQLLESTMNLRNKSRLQESPQYNSQYNNDNENDAQRISSDAVSNIQQSADNTNSNNTSIINTKKQNHKANTTVVNLSGQDNFITAKMFQKLHELRIQLFPLLSQFYKYLTGFDKTKKNKYDSLLNKIKKQIGELDADINEHPELYHRQFNFLNIIIACEIFMAYKFVFEEKFRKSKYSLLNKYEKITHRKEFVSVHGKSELCLKEYVPSQFEEDHHNEGAKLTVQKKKSNIIINTAENSTNNNKYITNSDISKLVNINTNSKLQTSPNTNLNQYNPNRNELLYNYFKNIFSRLDNESLEQKSIPKAYTTATSITPILPLASIPPIKISKSNYYPYFWMMFEELSCSLIEIVFRCFEEKENQEENNIVKLKALHHLIIGALDTEVDYGILGLYENNNKHSIYERNQNSSSHTNGGAKDKDQQKDLTSQQSAQSNIPSISSNAHRLHKQYIIRGLICLGSKTYEDFQNSFAASFSSVLQTSSPLNMNINMNLNSSDDQFEQNMPRFHKIDPHAEKQRKQVENIWDNTVVLEKQSETENDSVSSEPVKDMENKKDANPSNIRLCMILNF